MSSPALLLEKQFLTREETCQRLNLSPRTLEKWVTDGRIQSRKEPNRERVYEAADVERIRQEMEARAARQPERTALVAQPKQPQALSLAVPSDVKEAAREIGERFFESQRQVPVYRKLWLTWKEASAYSGLPPLAVRQLADEKNILARKFGRSWRVNRESLEWFSRYREDLRQASSEALDR